MKNSKLKLKLNKKEIYEILYYFEKNHSLKDTKLTNNEGTDPISLMKTLGYTYEPYSLFDENVVRYNFGGTSKVYDIKNYDYFVPAMTNKYNYKNLSIDFTNNNLIIINENSFKKIIKIEDIALYFIKNYSDEALLLDGQIVKNLEYKIKLSEINKEFTFIIRDLNCSYKESEGKVEDIYFDGVCFIRNIEN